MTTTCLRCALRYPVEPRSQLKLLEEFERRVGVVILKGYGLSETASTATFNQSAAERKAYSVGKPIWGTEAAIWDKNNQRHWPLAMTTWVRSSFAATTS